jgi:hypothetical protein
MPSGRQAVKKPKSHESMDRRPARYFVSSANAPFQSSGGGLFW